MWSNKNYCSSWKFAFLLLNRDKFALFKKKCICQLNQKLFHNTTDKDYFNFFPFSENCLSKEIEFKKSYHQICIFHHKCDNSSFHVSQGPPFFERRVPVPRCQNSPLWKPTDHRGHELLQVPQFGLSAEDDSTSVSKQTHKQTSKTNKKKLHWDFIQCTAMPKISAGRKSAQNWSSWAYLLLSSLWQFLYGVGAQRFTTSCHSVHKIYFAYYFSLWSGCKMNLFTSAMWMQANLSVHNWNRAFRKTPDACRFILP